VLAVAYFAALLARSADRWTARDADLDQIEDVAGLVEFMRDVPEDDEEEEEPDTSVLLLEQEDVWFAVIRLDADEDPRLFVSDMAAVSRSAYADLLLSADLLPVGPDGRPAQQSAAVAGSVADDLDVLNEPAARDAVDDGEAGAGEAVDGADVIDDELLSGSGSDPAAFGEEPAAHRPLHSGPAGDANLLADFGVRATKLVGLCGEGKVPADALADVAEALGAADELEEVR
jgi:putative tRNA adenosine deaminase-associated protein